MRVVTEARKFNHTSQVLLELNWLPIRHRITCKLMTIVYQCLHGLEPMTACLSQLWRTDGISGMLTVIVPRRGPIFTNIVFKIHPQMCHKIILRQKLWCRKIILWPHRERAYGLQHFRFRHLHGRCWLRVRYWRAPRRRCWVFVKQLWIYVVRIRHWFIFWADNSDGSSDITVFYLGWDCVSEQSCCIWLLRPVLRFSWSLLYGSTVLFLISDAKLCHFPPLVGCVRTHLPKLSKSSQERRLYGLIGWLTAAVDTHRRLLRTDGRDTRSYCSWWLVRTSTRIVARSMAM